MEIREGKQVCFICAATTRWAAAFIGSIYYIIYYIRFLSRPPLRKGSGWLTTE